MTKSVYKNETIDFTQEPLFYGSDLNISGNPETKYPVFATINKQMKKFFWLPEGKDLSLSRSEYKNADDAVKHILISNLKYQTLLDSVQKRGPSHLFMPIVSNPDLESCILTWSFFEHIHEDSYRVIAETMLNKSSDLYDGLIDEPAIKRRVSAIVSKYDEAIKMNYLYARGEVSSYEAKRTTYLALVSVVILEGILFYNSFLSNFAITEKLHILEGANKIIKEILRDENLHLALTQTIITILKSGKEGDEWVQVITDCESEVFDMFDTAVNQESEWGKHLMSKGSILGLNEAIFTMFAQFRANRCLKMIGLRQVYEAKLNPCPWMDKWQSDDENQTKPQESELESYVEIVSMDVTLKRVLKGLKF